MIMIVTTIMIMIMITIMIMIMIMVTIMIMIVIVITLTMKLDGFQSIQHFFLLPDWRLQPPNGEDAFESQTTTRSSAPGGVRSPCRRGESRPMPSEEEELDGQGGCPSGISNLSNDLLVFIKW